MNKESIQALNALAEKLGTTAEYLWNVLVEQAFISAITDLAILAGLSLLLWKWWLVIKKNSTVPPKTKEDRYPSANWDESQIMISYWSVVLGTVLLLIILLANVTSIVSGLFNSEYWALRQLMSMLRSM